ncbi:MAG TPA: nucleotidyltransferase family protein [Bacillales bacterium]|nr:nucleotidyltransferase family protein [Bacillales bacterium]
MEKWQDLLVSPSNTIIETMKIIDQTAGQIAIVHDQNLRLLGTVTDGDIRRGILSGVSLDDEIQRIMNKSPMFVRTNDSFYKVVSIFQAKKLRHLPVVDDDMRLMDIHFADHFMNLKQKDNVVIIMAGGLGTRLQPLTNDIPKPMLTVGEKPILETTLESFIEQGFHRFLLSVNYKKELIIDHFGDGSKWGVTIEYLNEEKRLGTAGALSLLAEKPDKPFIVMNGDILTKVNYTNLLDFHKESKAHATMCVREFDYQVPYGVVKTNGHLLKGIEEKPVQKFFVNGGIYVLEPDVVNYIPEDSFYDMPTLFEALIGNELLASAFPIREYWMDIGRMVDYEKANGEFMEVFG